MTYEVWQPEYTAWVSRCDKATRMLVAIGRDALRQLLGNTYDERMELRSVRKTIIVNVPERPSPRTKGRTQIIDLTGGLG